MQSLAVVLCIFRDPPQCFSQQPDFFPFASAICLSCVCLEGIKSLHESCNGSGIVAKAYSVSCSTGMCFSQLDRLLYQETHPDLGLFLSELSDCTCPLRLTHLSGEIQRSDREPGELCAPGIALHIQGCLEPPICLLYYPPTQASLIPYG